MENIFENMLEEDLDAFEDNLIKQNHRWAELNVSKSPETFAEAITGTMNMSAGVFRYRASDFSGDIVFFDKSFIASGSCTFTNVSQGRSSAQGWFIEYESSSDAVELRVGTGHARIASVSSNNSAANLRLDIPQQRVIFVVRKIIGFPGDFKLHSGSNLVIQGQR